MIWALVILGVIALWVLILAFGRGGASSAHGLSGDPDEDY